LRERVNNRGNKNLIGRKVEELRKKKRMKQKELLAKLQIMGIDINASALSKIEGETRSVSDKELLGIAAGLCVSVETLVEGANLGFTVCAKKQENSC
jgi:transcriptional regulator with XRE-family HTH domain